MSSFAFNDAEAQLILQAIATDSGYHLDSVKVTWNAVAKVRNFRTWLQWKDSHPDSDSQELIDTAIRDSVKAEYDSLKTCSNFGGTPKSRAVINSLIQNAPELARTAKNDGTFGSVLDLLTSWYLNNDEKAHNTYPFERFQIDKKFCQESEDRAVFSNEQELQGCITSAQETLKPPLKRLWEIRQPWGKQVEDEEYEEVVAPFLKARILKRREELQSGSSMT